MKRHERHAEKHFRNSLREYVAAGVPTKRGMTPDQYVAACNELWNRCQTDAVYAIKRFIEPLIETEFLKQSSDVHCVLIARCDPEGRLVDAPPGYQRVEESDIFLSRIVFGSPPGAPTRRPSKSKVEPHLLAYFDILGFKSRIKKDKIEKVHQEYLQLIEDAVKPQRGTWTKTLAFAPGGDLVPALMSMPIEAAYASDSLLLYVPYHPNFVEEFLNRAALLFCVALRLGVPLRGAITFGRGAFHEKTRVFVGDPLVEASTLEQDLDWVGVVFGKSIRELTWDGAPFSPPESGAVPIPPHLVQVVSPPMKERGEGLFGGFVLDWPRIWRQTYDDSALSYLAALSEDAEQDGTLSGSARETIQARYYNTAYFFQISDMTQNWCFTKGSRLITPDAVIENPFEGLRRRT